MLSLNSYTRWGLEEMLNLTVEDLIAWQQTAREMYR